MNCIKYIMKAKDEHDDLFNFKLIMSLILFLIGGLAAIATNSFIGSGFVGLITYLFITAVWVI